MKSLNEYMINIYNFCREFNLNIDLRSTLWKSGFFPQMKSLPGLIKQEHESLKTITINKYKMIVKSP